MSSVKQWAVWNSSSSAKFNSWAFLSVNLTACSTWSTASFCSLRTPMRTDNGNFLRQLYGATFFTYEARCNLASPTCRKPCQEGRDSADKIDPLWRREWGRLVTTTFMGPLGARSRFTSALSVAAPIGSERTGRNQ